MEQSFGNQLIGPEPLVLIKRIIDQQKLIGLVTVGQLLQCLGDFVWCPDNCPPAVVLDSLLLLGIPRLIFCGRKRRHDRMAKPDPLNPGVLRPCQGFCFSHRFGTDDENTDDDVRCSSVDRNECVAVRLQRFLPLVGIDEMTKHESVSPLGSEYRTARRQSEHG